MKFLLENANAGLLLDPGLGKTSITLGACKVLKNRGDFKGVLVIAPLRPVYSVWPKEVTKWPEFNDFSVGILHDSKKDDVLLEDHDLFVMNYEGIDWLFGTKQPPRPKTMGLAPDAKAAKLAEWSVKEKEWRVANAKVKARLKVLFSKVDIIVFDELSKMKHHDTARFNSLKPHLGKFARRWGLTGSPAPNGLMDLFGQTYVLDMGRALGQYITHYRTRYFYPVGFDWKLVPGAADRIFSAVGHLFLRMAAEDYLDMPRVVSVRLEVDLPPKARKIYDAMEKEMWAEMDGEEFIAVNSAASSIKCEQIAQGALYKDRTDPLTGIPITGKREWSEIHNAKMEALNDLMEELQGQPILGGYHFGHDLARIIKNHGADTPHCDHNATKVDKLFTAWNKNELIELWGHPASMGHGNNLQEGGACHVVWFNIPWDYELYDQMIRRVMRQGNPAKVIYIYHIIAKDTIDEVKMIDKSNKRATQQEFFDAVEAYRKRRM